MTTKNNNKILWNDCDIPAKLFYKIIDTDNYTLLGEGSNEELEKAFDNIFDEYYELDKQLSLENLLRKRNKIYLLKLKEEAINAFLFAIAHISLNKEEREGLIDKINGVEGVKVNFSKTKDVFEEIKRVQDIVLGSLRNQIRIEEATEKNSTEKVKVSFERNLVAVQNTLGYNIDDNVSLRKFIELKKSAKEISESFKKKRKNGK